MEPTNQDLTLISQQSHLFSEDNGDQTSFIANMPQTVRKARGPVIDSMVGKDLLEHAALLVDDTAKNSIGEPLPISTKVMVSYEGMDLDIKGRLAFNAFDREVIDAVATLTQKNQLITAAMVFRVMMGKTEYQFITEQQEQRVEESLAKCAFSRIQLDLTELYEKDSAIGGELKKAGIEASFSGNVLSLEEVTLKRGKKKIRCYRLLSQPPIIRYAAELGKISEFPIELLDTSINKTERNIILQSFLLRRIDEMIRGEDTNRFIPVESLYEAIEEPNASRQHKSRYRSVAETILQDWVEKGFLSAYRTKKLGNAVKGYEIELSDRFPGQDPSEKAPER